jgi:formylglycine-generating enzyme required for sulfatase activity
MANKTCPVCGLEQSDTIPACGRCNWDFSPMLGTAEQTRAALAQRLTEARAAWGRRADAQATASGASLPAISGGDRPVGVWTTAPRTPRPWIGVVLLLVGLATRIEAIWNCFFRIGVVLLLVGLATGWWANQAWYRNGSTTSDKGTAPVAVQPPSPTLPGKPQDDGAAKEVKAEAAGATEPPSAPAPAATSEPELVSLKAGCYQMGSPEGEPERIADERQHQVCLNAFAIGKTEVTQAQWRAVMGKDPPTLGFKGCDRCPVERVSWNDVQEYLGRLNARTGLDYRLPSEAEWEYAARAGTQTPFSTGHCIDTRQANYNGRSNYNETETYKGCNADTGVYLGKTQPVGSYPPNPWGLYDMHGNVWEWVEDCWTDFSSGAPTDGSAFKQKSCRDRVLRGGSWYNSPTGLRSANRLRDGPGFRYFIVGFRVARTVSP